MVRSATRSAPPAEMADESLGSVLAALAANTTIAIAKGTAAALTGSPALFAETLHTVADAGNEVFLFIAIRRSRHPADASHPFGYGPERYYWALLAAIGMFVVGGAVSIWDGLRALVHPPELDAFWVGVAVLVIALVLDGISRTVALRQLRVQAKRANLTVRDVLRESADPTVVTVYFEDTIDVLGAALALLALVLHRVTGSGIPDALASVVIGGLLCYLALRLTRRNRQLLTNQSVPERYVQRLRARLEDEAEIEAVTRLDAVYLGPRQVLAAADIRMVDGLGGEEVAAALARTRAGIAREIPAVDQLYLTPVP
jgi:cation diffusion facilitator family transporter